MSEQGPATGSDETSDVDIEEPEPVEEGAEVEDVPALAKWPWWASAIAAVIVLLALGVTLHASWTFITTQDEVAEQEDFEQLLGIVDRVETVALFVLGAIFGASASVGAASGAASAAKKNAREATKNHQKAKRNGRSAKKNGDIARLAKSDALALADVLDSVDQTRFRSGPMRLIKADYPLIELSEQNRASVSGFVRGDLDDSLDSVFVVPREDLVGGDAEDVARGLAEAMDLAEKIRLRWRV